MQATMLPTALDALSHATANLPTAIEVNKCTVSSVYAAGPKVSSVYAVWFPNVQYHHTNTVYVLYICAPKVSSVYAVVPIPVWH